MNLDTVKFKIILLGEASVGKSSIAVRFYNGEFKTSNESTIGVAFKQKTIIINQGKVNLECWDTAGQERFNSLTQLYFNNSYAIILIYDAYEDLYGNQKRSLNKIKTYWIPQIKKFFSFENCDKSLNVELYLVATKCDLLHDIKNDRIKIKQNYHDIKNKFNLPNLKWCMTSSKTGDGIDNLFIQLATDLYKTQANSLSDSVFQLDCDDIIKKKNWNEYCC